MSTERKFTGWHALAIFVGAFGIIISVNIALAWNAVSTFSGLEVKNSYIASQSFDARRSAQQSLGWETEATVEDGRLVLSIRDAEGRPVQAGTLEAIVGRPTHMREDFAPAFAFDGRDYVAPADLGTGAWRVRLKAASLDGTAFEQRLELFIRG